VGDHDDGRAFVIEGLKNVHHLLAIGGIEVAGRFVREDQLGIADDGAGDGRALLLTAGKLVGKWRARWAMPTLSIAAETRARRSPPLAR
jgi:hypothetical protein